MNNVSKNQKTFSRGVLFYPSKTIDLVLQYKGDSSILITIHIRSSFHLCVFI